MDVENALKKKNATPQRVGGVEHRKIKNVPPQGMRCYVVDFGMENRKAISFFSCLNSKKLNMKKRIE